MFYSQSCLFEVYHSGKGSKINQTPEKKYIYEVLIIVIGDVNITFYTNESSKNFLFLISNYE